MKEVNLGTRASQVGRAIPARQGNAEGTLEIQLICISVKTLGSLFVFLEVGS